MKTYFYLTTHFFKVYSSKTDPVDKQTHSDNSAGSTNDPFNIVIYITQLSIIAALITVQGSMRR